VEHAQLGEEAVVGLDAWPSRRHDRVSVIHGHIVLPHHVGDDNSRTAANTRVTVHEYGGGWALSGRFDKFKALEKVIVYIGFDGVGNGDTLVCKRVTDANADWFNTER
jgi:hypothetical protein